MRAIKFILALTALSSLPTIGFSQIADNTEIGVLLQLYNSTNGGAWLSQRWDLSKLQTQTSFSGFDLPNDLPGVKLNANGDVSEIVLPLNNNVVGTLPSDLSQLLGLEKIVISGNAPSQPNRNIISGVMPNLGTLVNLRVLDLYLNNCSGTVNWLGNFPLATKIVLTNDAQGSNLSISLEANISSLTSITELSLSYNAVTLIHDNIQYMDNLLTLNLASCGLTSSSFPNGFGGMLRLNSLMLSGNSGLSSLPAMISNLSALRSLYLSATNLSSIHTSFDQLDQLILLDISSNSLGSSGGLFAMVQILDGCLNLAEINLANNGLTVLTPNFSDLVPLRKLTLDLNALNATALDPLIGKPITELSMQHCMLTTSLPTAMTSMNSLSKLLLNNTSSTPSSWDNAINLNSTAVELVLKNIPNLLILEIRRNGITGPLPTWFGSEKMVSLKELKLSSNFIQLPLPDNFKLMVNLEELDISHNQLSGPLPDFFSLLTKLKTINLNNNQLTSPLPNMQGMTQLTSLHLYENKFTGDFPSYFPTISTLRFIGIQSDTQTGNRFTSFPSFSSHPFKSSLSLMFWGNELHFGHIEPNFDGVNDLSIASIGYAPQYVEVGETKTFYSSEGLTAKVIITTPGSHNRYRWQKLDGSSWVFSPLSPAPSTNPELTIPNITLADGGTYRCVVTNEWATFLTLYSKPVYLVIVPPLCASAIPSNVTGTFKMDVLTGTIVFDRSDCTSEIPITCVFGPSQGLDNIVSASATTHSDTWSYAYKSNHVAATNPFSSGERGKWRPQASYTYNSPVNQANDKNYNAGTFKYKTFNWKHGEKSGNPGWLQVDTISKYSPNGETVEERNALKIASTAKFGYTDAVPYLIAQNSEFNSVLFESFENFYSTVFEDDFDQNSGNGTVDPIAHAGNSSFRINSGADLKIRSFLMNKQIKTKGIQVKVWLRKNNNGVQLMAPTIIILEGSSPVDNKGFEFIARTGEWSLYQVVVSPDKLTAFEIGEFFDLRIRNNQAENVWIDDVRIQPMDTEMTAYVYDKKTLRLLTVFDDQHFGLYYQYNAEGKLVRKIIETQRGSKTIQETQYNTPTN